MPKTNGTKLGGRLIDAMTEVRNWAAGGPSGVRVSKAPAPGKKAKGGKSSAPGTARRTALTLPDGSTVVVRYSPRPGTTLAKANRQLARIRKAVRDAVTTE
jgi:hypothetical protein